MAAVFVVWALGAQQLMPCTENSHHYFLLHKHVSKQTSKKNLTFCSTLCKETYWCTGHMA